MLNRHAAGGSVAKRGSQPEEKKTPDEDRDSVVCPGDAIRPITQMIVAEPINLWRARPGFKPEDPGQADEDGAPDDGQHRRGPAFVKWKAAAGPPRQPVG